MKAERLVMEALPGASGLPSGSRLTPDVLARHAPSATVCVRDEDRIVAHASVWTEGTPLHNGSPVAAIGHFAAETPEAAGTVLDACCDFAAQSGLRFAVGPMDGNTWRQYRFVTERGHEPAFLMEPDQPPEWPEWWLARAFEPLALYFSAITAIPAPRDERLARVRSRQSSNGIAVRPLNKERLDDELRAIHKLSLVSFKDNYLYTPLREEEFVQTYAGYGEHLNPRFVLMAEHDHELCGFVFAIPDLAEAQRGERVRTLIVKTLAVCPGRLYAGLGAVLLEDIHGAAEEAGFQRVIHALMYEGNESLNLSGRSARRMRRYTLFAKEIS